MRTRRPAWKILGALVALLVLGVGVFFAWVQAVAARRWDALQAKLPGLIAEGRGRDPRRPVRDGEPVPGNAWDDYKKALAALGGMRTGDLADFVSRSPKADRAKVEALLAAGEGWRAHLAAGARKAEGVEGLAYEQGFDSNISSLLRSQNLVNLAVSQARFLLEEGKTADAVDLLLDAAWFGADAGRNTLLINELIAQALLAVVFDELRSLVRDPARTDVDWPALGRALELLDASFPDHAETLMNEVTCAIAGLSTPQGADAYGMASPWLAWRCGFSSRIMTVDAMETYLDVMRGAAAACRTSFAAAQHFTDAKVGDPELKRNPLLPMVNAGFLNAHRVGVERRTQLRLLRTAVAVRAGGPLPALDDPFSDGKLRTDGSKVWSVGSDGLDGGGRGGWKPAEGVDLVLELPE